MNKYIVPLFDGYGNGGERGLNTENCNFITPQIVHSVFKLIVSLVYFFLFKVILLSNRHEETEELMRLKIIN